MADQAEKLRELVKALNPETPTSAPKPEGKKKTRVVTITSGKGGVGKTNMSVNLAIAYARMGKKVILLDADLGLANVNVVLGVIPKYTLYHMIRQQKTMREILTPTDYGIQFVAGASGFTKIANMSDSERAAFIQELSTLSEADILIVDTSAGVTKNVLDFVAAADDTLIITTPEPTAITDAYGIIKIIATEFSVADMGLKLIVNRVQSVVEGKRVAERVINIASQFLNVKVDYLGFVYEDPIVQSSVLRQRPFLIQDPKSRASQCLMNIVNRMEKVDFREGRGIHGFLDRLLGRSV
ncbi:MAG: MinD/ParA family protein [Spirochaetales bacterium]|nr:MinD/ParA family protein [Spirochaetales bacterium]